MNPKRHITVEKYMMGKVYEYLKKNYHDYNDLIVSNSDELIFQLEAPIFSLPSPVRLQEEIENELGIKVHVNIFHLDGYNFFSAKEKHKRCTFYVKDDKVYDSGQELMCVPQPYFAMVYKLYNNLPVCNEDFHFVYENIDCIFNDNFYIEKISPKI